MIATAEQHAPCMVLDANGNEWLDMLWVNTETGEGEQYLRDEGGKLMVDYSKGEVCKATVYLPAPVRIEPMPLEYQS